MFRNVPACSGMFHVPDFIDGRLHAGKLERERNFWAIPISSETLSKDNNVRINVM